eukprot:gene41787-51787_t
MGSGGVGRTGFAGIVWAARLPGCRVGVLPTAKRFCAAQMGSFDAKSSFMEHPHPMRLFRRHVVSQAIPVVPSRQALTSPSLAAPRWKQALARALWVAGAMGALAVTAVAPAHANSEASAVLSLLPVASVVAVAGGASAAGGAVVALPAALSVTGAALVVKSVEASAAGTLYVLERASDGARVSVEVVGRGLRITGLPVAKLAIMEGQAFQ